MVVHSSSLNAQWSLDSCIGYAFHHNISVLQSRLNIQLAQTNQTTALGSMLPSLNGSATHGYNWGQRIDPFTNQFASQRIQSNSFGLATGITLFSGFQQYNGLIQANLNAEQSRVDFERAKNDVALNVASGYLTVLLNQEFVLVAEGNVAITKRQLDRLLKLVRAGQISEGQWNELNAQLATNEASLVAAQNNYSLSLLSLMQLLAIPGSEQANFSLVVPDLSEIDQQAMLNNPDQAVSHALSTFPQIKSAEIGLASALVGEKIAKGAFSPRVTANFSYGTGYSGAARVLVGKPDSVFVPLGTILFNGIEQPISLKQPVFGTDDYRTKPFSDQWRDNVNRALFFNLTVPIFNGFSTTAGVKRARVNREIAALQLEQAKLNLEQSVQRSWADARAALSSYQAAKRSTEANQTAFDWAQQRYEQGVINAVDFADAQTRLLNAKASEVRARYDYLFKVKILDFYLGKPLSLK